MSDPAPETTATAARLPDHLARAVADPASYAEMDTLHETFREIRRDHPFARADLPDYPTFWVASKFDDIQAVARQNTVFLSSQGSLATKKTLAMVRESGEGFRSVVGMNEPDHAKYRLLTQAWLVPKNIKKLEDGMRRLARQYVARLGEHGGEIDFVREIAVHYPLLVVMSILGVPAEDEPMMLRLTQEYFGAQDEELARGAGRTPEETLAGTQATVA